MQQYHSLLPSWDLTDAPVLLRADLNLPLYEGKVFDDFRLEALIPTLHLLTTRARKTIIATHLGRPKAHTQDLSTRVLIPLLHNHGFEAAFARTPADARDTDTPLVLLENLRFFPEETKKSPTFAAQLAACAEYYVNDAFGALHRDHTSITLAPELFDTDRRTIGLLVERELQMLTSTFTNPHRPLCLIVGGGKVKDKLPFINHFLGIADTILLCPALSMTFALAQGAPIGASLVDESAIHLCKQTLEHAAQKGTEILLPLDYHVAHESPMGPLSIVPAGTLPQASMAISVGPKTIAHFSNKITASNTVLLNGLCGFLSRPETLEGVGALFDAMRASPGTSIVAGGDAVGALRMLKKQDGITSCSTGGGSTLAFITGQQLPGLRALGIV